MTEIKDLLVTELVDQIRNGELKVEDVVVTFLNRIEKLNKKNQVFTSFDKEYSLLQAQKIDISSGLLPGVPIGVKDIINTEFFPTGKGSPLWDGYKAGNDARCISYLKDNGAIICGKTDTAELAVHANHKVKNPYNFDFVTGSSSGGSAAAVSLAMVPASIGTQTGGSIIRPGSWCGVFAMKPSFGLIPRTGVLKTTDTLDSIGFFARGPKDLNLLLEAMRIHGSNFPIQEKQLNEFKKETVTKVKFGAVRPDENACNEVQVNFDKLLNDFKSEKNSVEIVEIDLPNDIKKFRSLHRRIYHPCLAYYLRAEVQRGTEKISPILQQIFDDAATIPPEDYKVALEEQRQLAHQLEVLMSSNGLDSLLTISSNGSAEKSEPSIHLDYNALWTMAWLPVIQVPRFKNQLGLPYGIQFVGQRFSDYKLLNILETISEKELITDKSEISFT